MNFFKTLLIVFASFVVVNNSAYAQVRKSYFTVGGSLGAFNYKGDLDDDFTLKFTKPGLGAFVMMNFNPHIAVRFSFQQGWAGASDKDSKNTGRNFRNLSFKTHISELSTQFIYEFIATTRRFKYRPKFSPYVFAGISIYNFNPKADLNGKTYALKPLGTEGQYLKDREGMPEPYSLVQLNIPFGLGFRYKLNQKMDIRAEVGIRKLFTDYLDDVSGNYVDPNKLLDSKGMVAVQLADRSDWTEMGRSAYSAKEKRGFSNNKDWYIVSSVSVSYILDKGNRRPKYR